MVAAQVLESHPISLSSLSISAVPFIDKFLKEGPRAVGEVCSVVKVLGDKYTKRQQTETETKFPLSHQSTFRKDGRIG